MKFNKKQVFNKKTLISTGLAATSLVAFGVWHQQPIHKFKNSSLASDLQKLASGLQIIQTAHASTPTYTQNVMNLIRKAVGNVVGFSDAGYLEIPCNGNATAAAAGNCDGPPQQGIVGLFDALANKIPTIASNGGIASCSDAPASGTFSGKDSDGVTQTLTFQTPTHQVPSNWVGGGTTFQKRVKLPLTVTLNGSTTSMIIAMEFNCDSNVSYTAVTMTVANGATIGMNGTGFTRNIAVFTGPVSSTINGIDVYYTEAVPAGTTIGTGANTVTGPSVRGGTAMKIEFNPSANTYNLWASLLGDSQGTGNNNLQHFGHLIASGNYSTSVASVYYDGLAFTQGGGNNGSISQSSLDSSNAALMASDTLSTTSDFSLAADISATTSGTEIKKQGCITFTADTTGPTSNSLCPGLSLIAATSAPAIDSAGKFSADWMMGTLPGKLETLQ